MPTIYDIITSTEIATYWNIKSKERKPFFGESKFPSKKKLGLDLSWIKGVKNSPVSLQLSAFDAKAIPLSRQGFDKMTANMPFFKNSKNIDETQRQELNKVIGSGNQSIIDIIINNIFDDKGTLLESADIAREIMRMQLLTSGTLALASNGQKYTYDYGMPSDQKVSPTNKWDNLETSDPIADITDWQDIVEQKTGVRPTEILMNSFTFKYLRNSKSIKNAIYLLGQGLVTPNATKVKEYILTETGVTVFVYDKGYTNENGVFTKFVPNNIVTLMPSDNIGLTWFGTTPEESDLTASAVANVSIVDTGVAITTSKETDPVNVMTKVTQICLPSFEMADSIIIATVATSI